jgi:hypothetical protein
MAGNARAGVASVTKRIPMASLRMVEVLGRYISYFDTVNRLALREFHLIESWKRRRRARKAHLQANQDVIAVVVMLVVEGIKRAPPKRGS